MINHNSELKLSISEKKLWISYTRQAFLSLLPGGMGMANGREEVSWLDLPDPISYEKGEILFEDWEIE